MADLLLNYSSLRIFHIVKFSCVNPFLLKKFCTNGYTVQRIAEVTIIVSRTFNWLEVEIVKHGVRNLLYLRFKWMFQ